MTEITEEPKPDGYIEIDFYDDIKRWNFSDIKFHMYHDHGGQVYQIETDDERLFFPLSAIQSITIRKNSNEVADAIQEWRNTQDNTEMEELEVLIWSAYGQLIGANDSDQRDEIVRTLARMVRQ